MSPTQLEFQLFIYVACMISLLISGYHDLTCPAKSQLHLRAQIKCNNTEIYHCLYDENINKFKEFCLQHPWFDTAGYKINFVGDLHGVPCEDDRYQPFKSWANGSASSCVFEKSECIEEGQLIASNGSTKSDRLCRCDYTKNYDYITKPKNPCSCVPSEEDCSCYRKLCNVGYILTPDYECVLTTDWKTDFNCPLILGHDGQTNTIPPFVRIPKNDNDIDKSRIVPLIILVLVSTASLLVTAWIILCLVLCKTTNQKKHLTQEQVVYNGISKPSYAYVTEYEKDQWTKRLGHFVETRAFTEIIKAVKVEQCVMIIGPPGCGKSATAFYVASMLEKMDDYDILVVVDPQDIVKYATTDTKQIFVLDDAFGTYSVNESNILWWNRQGAVVKNLLERKKNMKLVMTCRSHIYSSLSLDQIRISVDVCSLISKSLQLTAEEKRLIAKAYINDASVNTLSEDILMLFDFFPALCARFSRDDHEQVVEYFSTPSFYLDEHLKCFHKFCEIIYFVIALLVVKNNKIDREWFHDDNHKDDEMMKELSYEIGCLRFPSKPDLLFNGNCLKGTYLKETESGLTFLNDQIFNICTLSTSKHNLKTLLKYGDSSLIRSRFVLGSLKSDYSNLTIVVPKHFEKKYFERQLIDLKNGFLSNVFTGEQNSIAEFRELFIQYLKKHLLYHDLKTSSDGSTPLHVVSQLGYKDYLTYFLTLDKERINKKNNEGKTPLHLACFNGHAHIVKLLLENDAYIDESDDDDNNQTSLDIACENNHIDTVQILLASGAKISQRRGDLKTALHITCETGNSAIAELLLAYNAKINVADKHKKTPLHIAISEGHIDIVEMLLKQEDLDINAADNKMRTPLLIACKKKDFAMAQLLINKKSNPNIDDLDGKSPLHFACEFGVKDIAILLIEKKAKLEKSDGNGNTPLHWASLNAHVDVIDKLLVSGCDINCRNKSGKTPLIIACKNRHISVVKKLLEFSPDINQSDTQKRSPLFYACEVECIELAHLLVVIKADVNKPDNHGNSPLHIVCQKGLTKILYYMEPFIQDVNQRNNDNLTPLLLACRGGNFEMVQTLIKFGASVNSTHKTATTPLLEACRQGHQMIVEVLFNHEASPNQADASGITPLMACCENGHSDLVSYLLNGSAEFGKNFDAAVNLVDKMGMTPLHKACINGNKKIAELLLTKNALFNNQDRLGQTPLYKSASAGHFFIVKLLIEKGASIDICDKNKISPLQVALQKGHKDVADFLKEKTDTATRLQN